MPKHKTPVFLNIYLTKDGKRTTLPTSTEEFEEEGVKFLKSTDNALQPGLHPANRKAKRITAKQNRTRACDLDSKKN